MSYTTLKLIALITMYIDHIGVIFYNDSYRHIGRISFVLYAFLIANGLRHTKNQYNYIMNLFKFALFSEIFYDYFIFITNFPKYFKFLDYYELDILNSQNVLFTLGFGALACYFFQLYKSKANIFYLFTIVVCLLIPTLINSDYGLYGSTTIFLFYLSKNKIQKFFIVFLFTFFKYIRFGLYSYAIFALIAGVIILFYNNKKGFLDLNKYVFYLFYPAHMLFLSLVITFI